jgi:hypothetical protein
LEITVGEAAALIEMGIIAPLDKDWERLWGDPEKRPGEYYVVPNPRTIRLPLDYGHGDTVLSRVRQAIARPDAEIRKAS